MVRPARRSSRLCSRPPALGAATLLFLVPVQAADHFWTAGNFVAGVTAPSPLPAGDVLFGQPGSNNKNFLGIQFLNQGTVAWQTTDRIGFVSAAVTNSALWDLQADASLLYAGGSASTFANDGVFRKSGGIGTSGIGSNVVFVNSGIVDTQVGIIDFAGGSASFLSGTQFTGAGVARIGHNAGFAGALVSENLELAAGTFSGDNAVLSAGSVRWTGGRIGGTWQVDAGQSLNGLDGGDKDFSGSSFTNLGTLNWETSQRIGFVSASVSNAGLWDLQADASLSYAGGAASTLANTGTLRKSGGGGSSVVGANLVFVNTGVIDVLVGSLEFAGGSASFQPGTQFTGAGTVRISHNVGFAGSFTSENLLLAGGSFTGDSTTPAALSGIVRWTGGSFAGTWQVGDGHTLQAQAGSDKNFSGAVFTNHGTVVWQSPERAGFVSSTITNAGLWDIQADANLSYAGGAASSFFNQGTLRKSDGSGSAVIGSNVVFSNSGTIDAQAGTIDFAGGSVTFLPGTRFTGAGAVRIGNNAGFVGAFHATNLRLDGGTYAGDLGTPALMQGDVTWTGGSMSGTWQVAPGATLVAQDGGHKNFTGASFTNLGAVVWQSTERAGFVSSDITNAALWDIQADADLSYAGGAASSFVNQGTLRKSGGSGSSVISGNLVFLNPGTVSVLSGTLQFANSLASPGVVSGTGTVQTPLLTNTGLVAPGASASAAPATLTLAGSFAQGVGGVLQIHVESLASHDQLQVTGSVDLGGVLAVACHGSCTFDVGDELVVLDYGGSRNGTSFAGLALSGFATGGFEALYDDIDTRVLLRVTEAVTPVPEPGPAALLLAGLAVLGCTARRRRPC